MKNCKWQLLLVLVAGLSCVLNPISSNAQTRVTATEKKSSSRIEAERASIKNVTPVSNEIRCRGGQNKLIFTPENSHVGTTGETIITMLLTFEPSANAAGPRGEGLRPGECSWADRPLNGRFLIRFDTPANAQLKQTLHGSKVDNSPTAAESYPDQRSIPIYMQSSDHYWSFIGEKPVNNFFVATGNGFYKPARSIQNVQEAPDFKQRKREVRP